MGSKSSAKRVSSVFSKISTLRFFSWKDPRAATFGYFQKLRDCLNDEVQGVIYVGLCCSPSVLRRLDRAAEPPEEPVEESRRVVKFFCHYFIR